MPDTSADAAPNPASNPASEIAPLVALADDLFTLHVERPFLGMRFGTRLTVLRLPDGGLWVHSPIPLTSAVRAAVDALGPVRHLVAPNLLHHVSLPEWAAAYPDAVVHAPLGLERKQPSLTIHRRHGAADPAWGGVLEPIPLTGMGGGETLFLHGASGTLISADLALAIPPELEHWWTQLYLRLMGIHGKPLGCTLVHKGMAKDKPALRRTLDGLFERGFSRLVLAHTQVVEGPELKEQLAAAYAWVPTGHAEPGRP